MGYKGQGGRGGGICQGGRGGSIRFREGEVGV